MLSKPELDSFWTSRADLPTDPCHYLNEWQDKYSFGIRMAAISRLSSYFEGAESIVDIGCGIGTFTKAIKRLAPRAVVVGYDRKEFVQRAVRENPGDVTYSEGLVPSDALFSSVRSADLVTMLTVYNFMLHEERGRLLAQMACCKPGSYVLILDAFPDIVPGFQKVLGYKDIDTRSKVLFDFHSMGFDLDREEIVSRVDSRIFRVLGPNRLSYALTVAGEVVAKWLQPRYQVMVFKKLG